MTKLKIEIGKTYHKLTVLEYLGNSKCKCICDCGVERVVFNTNIGRTQSCGCIRKGSIKKKGNSSRSKHHSWCGAGELGGKKWCYINQRAKKFNIPVEISIEQASNIYESQNKLCYLSGLPIEFYPKKTASLDRLNCSIGYTLENSKWCHKDVNHMKHIYSNIEYIEICKTITNFIHDFKRKEDLNIHFSYYKSLRNKAKSKKINFNLTEEYILEIFKNQGGRCFLTGVDLIAPYEHVRRRITQTMSLCRFDNSLGYEIGNICIINKSLTMSKNKFNLNYYKEICKLVTIHNTKIT